MKKFLALVLALVMTMSLVTISAGAEDYTDVDNINYVEAVDVVSALGIVGGYADGSFGPNGTLTRGAAAKIICNLILGTTTASALSADTAPYKDVPVNHTFAGYIAYCQSEGIVSGYADGTFQPAAPLTGYAFMKMLLGCLGYDSTLENYVGANWSVNVAKRALSIGLDNGMIDDFNGMKPVTRQEAALFTFNTLSAGVVSYEDKGTNITIGGTTINTGASEAEYTSNADAGYANNLADSNNRLQFAEKHFTRLTRQGGGDAFNRPSDTWFYKGVKIGTYADNATLTYTGSVKGGEIFADLGMSTKDDVPLVYLNGEVLNGTATDGNGNTYYVAVKGDTDGDKDIDVKDGDFEVAKSNDVKLSQVNGKIGDGTKIEVFLNKSNNQVTICAMSVYAGEVTKVKAATATKDAYVVVDDKYAPNYIDGANFNNQFETDVFEIDDMVAFTYSNKDHCIVDMETMDSVSGTLTKHVSTKSINLDTTTYKFAEEYTLGDTLNTKSDYTAYVDSNGLVLYVKLNDVSVENYALVLDIKDNDGTWGDGNVAKLLFTDGTVKTVSLAKDYVDNDGKYGKGGDNTADMSTGVAPVAQGNIVSFKVEDDGDYKLTVPTTQDKDAEGTFADAGDVVIDEHVIKFTGGDNDFSTTLTTDNKTVFVVEKKANEYTVFTGLKNVPDITAADAYTLYKNNTAGSPDVVRVVFLLNGTVSSSAADVVFVAGKSMSKVTTDVDNNTFYTFNAVVKGEITTVMIDDTVKTTDSNALFNNYTVTDGIITAITGWSDPDATTGSKTGVRKYSDDEMKLGNVIKSVAKNADLFLIDTDGNIEAVEDIFDYANDDNDLAYYVEKDGEIISLFIVEVKG